ncbi:FecR domain-containing protein [Pseudobdellovibrio sp. HCB154]|uniref:FecR family protein n=1 Tax=Pseudobdellovibrio sp. HCB154 TaxID=3386277 RepID=UPI003916F4F6
MGRIFAKIQFAFITVLLFSLNTFAGGAIAGKVTIVKGQVFIVRSGEKIQVKKDTTVLESDVIESQAGGTARITMIDSNLVDVYPKSKVEIAKYVYKPNQDQKDVELKVDFGKIKSTVNQKYDGAKNKFQVKTPSAVAGVRGTVFTAEYDLARKVSKVVTIEGLVAVTKIIDRERQTPPVFVRPDQVVKVDAEQAKTEQPRDLKSDEREERKKEDKDLGYQYDPKKEPTPGEGPSSKNESPVPDKNVERPVKELPSVAEDRPTPPVKEIQPVKEIIKEVQVREPVRETPPIKEISAREPVKSDKEERRERPQTLRDAIKDTVKNASERRQERQAEQQEKRQTASEDQQAKKQKQSEDEQAKKQKQLEEEQSRKQKQSEEEQAKKQKQMEEEQTRKQKQSEEEQSKKQKQMEEEQARKQKQSEEEQAKKQKQMEEMLAAKRKHAEEAQAKREEEQKKRAEEQQARRAELARRLAEIAKRAETVIRLPSGTTGGSTTPTSPINTIIPKQ